MALSVQGAEVRYGSTTAVAGVDLDVAAGEVVAVLGPSGCGKSSLLRAVAGLEALTAGAVRWDGVDLTGVPVHRRGFGLMFQDGQLFPHRDVAGNVEFGLRMARVPQTERVDRVAELLDLVGLAGFDGRPISSLSGGEQQRVALARALAPRPRLLLLDEPLSALDRELRENLSVELRRILTNTGITAMYVTHDHDEAFAVADRVAVMRQGRLVQVGTPAELWAAPGDADVARFLGYRVVEHHGQTLALGPGALGLAAATPSAELSPHPGEDDRDARVVPRQQVVGEQVVDAVSGRVVATGFSRGRPTARVDVPAWGEVTAVVTGTGHLDPGDSVTLQIDRTRAVVLS
ncbi:ABC transporter ATP-binding protein [Ruania halotolerans]|uniref:ABC transporter ATP-binding protein n=1 Tax=Ruania halotolerans TaxID=2897773 RepID=UPI001E35D1F2|nr:ABC transporter ATP-binding protein [Ruania halotolerans]UFU06173.1 ABC transporter ATP-binding protein [Ruania halotolerans]